MQIEKVQSYKCPVCKEIFQSGVEAEKCFLSCNKRAQESKRREKRWADWQKKMNQLRLEAETPQQVLDLLVIYAKKHFGAIFEFSNPNQYQYSQHWLEFGKQSCHHRAPIGQQTNSWRDKNKPTHFLGWAGFFEGTWKNDGKNPFETWSDGKVDGVVDLIDHNGIKGVHMDGCFNGGKHFSGGLMFFLDDFPKMKKKYEEFQSILKNKTVFSEQEKIQNEKLNQLFQSEIAKNVFLKKNNEKIENLDKEIADLQNKRGNLVRARLEVTNKLEEEILSKKSGLFPIDKKYDYDKKRLEELNSIFYHNNMRQP